MRMTTCDEFQIAIEQAIHGALDPSVGASLQAHLAGCDACRDYERLAKGSEAHWRETAMTTTTQMDWDRIQDNFQRLSRQVRRQPLIVAIGFSLLVSWGLLTTKGGFWSATVYVGFMVVGLLVALLQVRRQSRIWLDGAAVAQEGGTSELCTFYRERLDGRLRELRGMFPTMFVIGAVGVVTNILDRRPALSFLTGLWLYAFIRGGFALIEWLRLRRERRAIG
jgi:hypothetical protein